MSNTDAAVAEKAGTQQPELDLAPEAWIQKLTIVAEQFSPPGQDWELRLALMVMDALAVQILGLEEPERNAFALHLYRSGGAYFLTKDSAKGVGTGLKEQELAPNLVVTPGEPNETPYNYNDPTNIDRLVTVVRHVTGMPVLSRFRRWLPLSGEDFDAAVKKLTDGKTPEEIREILGVEKLSIEARRRYKIGQEVALGEVLSATLLVVADYIIRSKAAQRTNPVSKQ